MNRTPLHIVMDGAGDLIRERVSVPSYIQPLIDLYGVNIVHVVDHNGDTALDFVRKGVRKTFFHFI